MHHSFRVASAIRYPVRMDRQHHWDKVYTTKTPQQVSWFEPIPEISLRLMEHAGLSSDTCVLDVGGGDSHVVDQLVSRGLDCLAVLDVSDAALSRARARLGSGAAIPTWINADVTGGWSLKPMDIWHDRAVFHFLTTGEERARYVEHARQVLKPHGTAIIATFAPDGPERCSGLPVCRYSPELLAGELGEQFTLVESVEYAHRTPWGASQSFQYSRFTRC
jgi:SAM-dependent methyltransferase